jgi:hypothetical protein
MTQSKFSKIYNSLQIASIIHQWLLCISVYFIVAVPLFSISQIHNNSKQSDFAYNATFILLMLVFLTFHRQSDLNEKLQNTRSCLSLLFQWILGIIVFVLVGEVKSIEQLERIFLIAVTVYLTLKLYDFVSDYLWHKLVIEKIFKDRTENSFNQAITAMNARDMDSLTNLFIEDNYQDVFFVSEGEHRERFLANNSHDEITVTTKAKRLNREPVLICSHTILPLISKAKLTSPNN